MNRREFVAHNKSFRSSMDGGKEKKRLKYIHSNDHCDLYQYCSISPEECRCRVEVEMKAWNFDQNNYSSSDLAILAAVTLVKKNVHQFLGLSAGAIGKFCIRLEQRYQSQPYHNFRHGFTVMHFTGRLLSRMDLMNQGRKQLNGLYRTGLMLAALCHDMLQPISPLTLQYSTARDSTSAEKKHVSRTARTLAKYGLFDAMNFEEAQKLQYVMQHLMLAMCMKYRDRLLKESQSLVMPKERRATANKQLLYSKMLIHCANLGTPTLEPKLSNEWSIRLKQEFAGQTFNYDYFVCHFVLPSWETLHRLMPENSITTMMLQLKSIWKPRY